MSQAISYFDAPVIVGVTVIYAYLLTITILILDIVYAILDPRMRIQG
jgi:peptide/nickel transport system permease protein